MAHGYADDDRPDDIDLEDKPVTASDVEEALAEIVSEANYAILEDSRTWTFLERGVLTHDKGIVLRLATGDEFQITIVQSKRAR